MNVLITGGAGFIGSHTIVELLSAGHSVYVVDNFINSTPEALSKTEQVAGQKIPFTTLDVRDTDKLAQILIDQSIDTVIHFAALKAVGESVKEPLRYYENNIVGLLSVLTAMKNAGVNRIIFSSSATVYGDPDTVPITEDFPLKPATNPYGATKQMGEQIITDAAAASDLQATLLRYFNPIGAHPTGLIGELPIGPPNNLVPYVAQAAAGVRDSLTVFGDDYDTPDGSGVRDYIHVVDLAKAHVKAAEALASQTSTSTSIHTYNIGTGNGTSVIELISTFEKVNNVKVPFTIGPRRPGDIASCYASADKADLELGWKAELSLEQALKDTWRWQQNIAG